MNERLASENASLVAELARFQSGKHPIVRRLISEAVSAAGGSKGMSQTSEGSISTSVSNAPSTTPQVPTVVGDALAAAVREVLLCSRQVRIILRNTMNLSFLLHDEAKDVGWGKHSIVSFLH